jgi:hypothetical protein
LIAVWVWYVRAVPGVEIASPAVPWWTAVREAIAMQMFWAYVRGTIATLAADDVSAAYISLAAITLCWLLNPWRRHDLFTPRRHVVVRDWMCALLTAFAWGTIRTLWSLVLMHTLWVWVSGRALAHLSPVSPGAAWAGD